MQKLNNETKKNKINKKQKIQIKINKSIISN